MNPYIIFTAILTFITVSVFIGKSACFWFGHRPAFGYGNSEGNGYFTIKLEGVDGINRHHARLTCECERCGKRFNVGRIHIPYQYVEALDEKQERERPFHIPSH